MKYSLINSILVYTIILCFRCRWNIICANIWMKNVYHISVKIRNEILRNLLRSPFKKSRPPGVHRGGRISWFKHLIIVQTCMNKCSSTVSIINLPAPFIGFCVRWRQHCVLDCKHSRLLWHFGERLFSLNINLLLIEQPNDGVRRRQCQETVNITFQWNEIMYRNGRQKWYFHYVLRIYLFFSSYYL